MVIVPLCGNGIGEERGDFGVGEGEACAGGDEGGRKGPFYPLSSDTRDLLKLGKMWKISVAEGNLNVYVPGS